MPPKASYKETSPTKDGNIVEPYADQPANKKESNSLPLKDKSDVEGLRQTPVENPSTEPRLRSLGKTRNTEHQDLIPIDVNNSQRAASSISFDDGVSQIEREVPKAGNPENELHKVTSRRYTTSPFDKLQQDHQNAHTPSTCQDKRRGKSQARRHSLAHTDSSSSIKKELLHISFNSLLGKLGKKLKQCEDIPVALNHFLNSHTSPRYSTEKVIAIRDQLKNTRNTMVEILRITNETYEQRNLNNNIVLDLEIFVANIGKCLDALESDFELFEISRMDGKNQQKTWDEMLQVFKKRNSSSLVDHLQITYSFGNALLAHLRAETYSLSECNEWREILLEINRMQSQSSRPIQNTRNPSSVVSLRRPHRTDQPHPRPSHLSKSDVYSSLELDKPYNKPRKRRDARHEKNTQKQDRSSSTPTEEIQPSPTGAVNWFWICQANIIPGCFATPWMKLFSEATCIGAISTVLHGLNAVIESPTCRYVDKQHRYQDWIHAGKVTYPSYALNAKGGVVVSGLYKPVLFAGFPGHLPPIELLRSYDYQVRRGICYVQQKPSAIVEDLAELMGLDTWLSLCGRTPPIYDGPANLLRTLSALAQCILSDLEFEFANLDRTTSTDDRLQLIQPVAESLTAALME